MKVILEIIVLRSPLVPLYRSWLLSSTPAIFFLPLRYDNVTHSDFCDKIKYDTRVYGVIHKEFLPILNIRVLILSTIFGLSVVSPMLSLLPVHRRQSSRGIRSLATTRVR